MVISGLMDFGFSRFFLSLLAVFISWVNSLESSLFSACPQLSVFLFGRGGGLCFHVRIGRPLFCLKMGGEYLLSKRSDLLGTPSLRNMFFSLCFWHAEMVGRMNVRARPCCSTRKMTCEKFENLFWVKNVCSKSWCSFLQLVWPSYFSIFMLFIVLSSCFMLLASCFMLHVRRRSIEWAESFSVHGAPSPIRLDFIRTYIRSKPVATGRERGTER